MLEEPRTPGLFHCSVHRRLLVHHVIAAQKLPRRRMGAFALLERNAAIDDGIPDAFGLLDKATLAAREVRGIHRAFIQKPELLLLVHYDVGSVTLSQNTPVGEASDPGRQAADLVVGLFQ